MCTTDTLMQALVHNRSIHNTLVAHNNLEKSVMFEYLLFDHFAQEVN